MNTEATLSRLLDFGGTCAFIGLPEERKTRLFLWRAARAGRFPAPLKLGEHRIAWRRDEIETWLESRPRAVYAKQGGR